MSTSPAPENPELVIRKLDDYITIFSTPFARLGWIPFGGRSTAIKLSDNTTFLIPSTALTPSTLSTLSSFPPVAHLICPDLEHTLFLESYISHYPTAKVYVPSAVRSRWEKEGKTELVDRISFTFGRGGGDPFVDVAGGEIKAVDFGKSFVNQDVAFLHAPTKTLIQADLLLLLPPTEQYTQTTAKNTLPILTNLLQPGSWLYRQLLWHGLAKDRQQMSECVERVAEWDFDRMIPCHGDVIDQGAKSIWTKAYIDFLTSKKKL